ncbi:MAG: phosphotriesterase-related protein [Thermoleophilia bacterium]
MPDGVAGPGQAQGIAGPIPADALGLVLPHEHILFDTSPWLLPAPPAKAWLTDAPVALDTYAEVFRDPLVCRDNLVFLDDDVAVDELERFREAGGGTIVDVTPPAMGRDVARVRRIAERSGVQVVVGTGHYVQSTHPPEVARQSVDEIAAWMIGEIRDGIDDTGIRPGVIGEIGTSGAIHPDERKCLEAAALTQQETGLAITVHCAIPTEKVGLDVVRVLERAGADPTRVILGHMSHTVADLDYHRACADTGAVLEYDRFGAEFLYESWGRYEEPRDSTVVAAVARLVADGYGDRIVLSHDACYRVQLARFGGGGYAHLARHVLPALGDAGVDEAALRRLTVETPARLLAIREDARTSRDVRTEGARDEVAAPVAKEGR